MASSVKGAPEHERDPRGDPGPQVFQHTDVGPAPAGAPRSPAEFAPPARTRRSDDLAAGAGAADDRTIADLAWTLFERRWTVVLMTGLAAGLAVLYLVTARPTYRASILIQVEGTSRPVTAFEDLAALFQENTPRQGEMRVMASRALLEGIVTKLRLDVEARPRTAPLVGGAIARRHEGPAPAPAPFGLTRYAWGGERIAVERLIVSETLVGEPLTLVALEAGRYRVAAPDGTALAEGSVGKPATGADGPRTVELLVSALSARPGTEFTLLKRDPLDVLDELQQGLQISEHGTGTGLVQVALTGHDPARVAEVLDALSASYVRQSVDRTSAEAAKMLRVLETQLPVLRSNLETAERSLNAFRQKNETMNISLEAEAMLARLADLDRAITEDELRLADTSRYTQQHPNAPSSMQRTERLRLQRAAVEARMRKLPELELQSMRLSRRMNAAAELYLLVLNRAEELRIVKSGWIGNARVLEGAAVPHRPVAPKAPLVLALGVILGLAAGVSTALAKDAFGRGAIHAGDVEAGAGIPVLASIPHSRAQQRLARGARRHPTPPLSSARPMDVAVEDLRGLRTSVQFALQHARNHVVAITGLAPRAGKSFVSVNLAHLFAAAGERVVLVESDLRRGGLHRHFGGEGQPGLTELLNGSVQLEQAVRATSTRGLDLLPGGTLPENPAELLAGDRLRQLLMELARRYAVVIVDAPPILAVSDAALVGRHAGVNLIVLRGGEHSVPELSDAVKWLARSGVTISGAVLNDVPSRRRGRTGRYRRYYRAAT